MAAHFLLLTFSLWTCVSFVFGACDSDMILCAQYDLYSHSVPCAACSACFTTWTPCFLFKVPKTATASVDTFSPCFTTVGSDNHAPFYNPVRLTRRLPKVDVPVWFSRSHWIPPTAPAGRNAGTGCRHIIRLFSSWASPVQISGGGFGKGRSVHVECPHLASSLGAAWYSTELLFHRVRITDFSD